MPREMGRGPHSLKASGARIARLEHSRRAPQRACEGYERLGLAFGRGDDRSSTAWCVLALCAAPSLPHPRAREARFRHVPSYRSRARPDMCTTVTTAPPVGPATPPPAQTACTSRGSRERARTMLSYDQLFPYKNKGGGAT